MKLVEFSVTNYRSITTAHKIFISNYIVLVGKNNEGKSNLLKALNVAMTAVMFHARAQEIPIRVRESLYQWTRDFPIQYQGRKSGLESIFKLHFRLEESELNEFHSLTGIRGNSDIPISVKFGKDGNPKIEVPKKGSGSYNRKSKEITEFISKRISFNYIQAVRTDDMALSALQSAIWGELRTLRDNPEYVEAQNKVVALQQQVLDNISIQLQTPLKIFIPNIKSVAIKQEIEEYSPRFSRNDIDIIIDDGSATSIKNKGDGIKSLVTLAILKDRKKINGASVIAIEEPESHLHSGAIHQLIDVIHNMSENNQVIISTHNPLFVQQNKVAANIIVDSGTAHPAKNIAEIRNILGVLPSDNLRNARYVLLVEGEDDKIALEKILPAYSESIKQALNLNMLVIKPLAGASNLSHDAADLKHCMCKYVALLDNDKAGIEAAEKAINSGLIKEAEIRYTVCNGSPESEFEDCLKPSVYEEAISEGFGVNIKCSEFKGNAKWSERLKAVFLSQGARWTETVEKKVKLLVAQAIPEEITLDKIEEVVIPQKAGFINGLASIVEAMLGECKN